MHRVSGYTLPQAAPLLVLLSVLTAPSRAQTSLEDGEILRSVFLDQSMRDSEQGGNPINYWLPGTDPCELPWEGIECNALGGVGSAKRVTKVLLTGYAMEGTVNTSTLPSTLTAFDISNNRLTGTVDMSGLSAGMRFVNLAGNTFQGPMDLGHFEHTSLFRLSLAGNEFSGPLDLGKLPKTLRDLYLQYNQFSGTPDLTDLPGNLIEIEMGSNEFTGTLDLQHLPPKLEVLSTMENHFSRIVPPVALPATLLSLHVRPLDGWGQYVCFERPLNMTQLGDDTDLPQTQFQKLCPTPAPAATPAPETPVPAVTPAPTGEGGTDLLVQGPGSNSGNGNLSTDDAKCVVGSMSCLIFAVVLCVSIVAVIVVSVGFWCGRRTMMGKKGSRKGKKGGKKGGKKSKGGNHGSEPSSPITPAGADGYGAEAVTVDGLVTTAWEQASGSDEGGTAVEMDDVHHAPSEPTGSPHLGLNQGDGEWDDVAYRNNDASHQMSPTGDMTQLPSLPSLANLVDLPPLPRAIVRGASEGRGLPEPGTPGVSLPGFIA